MSDPSDRDPSDPPRKHYQLKPKEFEIVNAPVSSANADSSPTHVRGHLQAAHAREDSDAARPPTAPRTNDVHALLRDNLARANAAGLNTLAAKPERHSRRKRHYWALMVVGTALFAGIAAITGPRMPIPFIYSIAGLVIFNLSLWWVMWHIMDDY